MLNKLLNLLHLFLGFRTFGPLVLRVFVSIYFCRLSQPVAKKTQNRNVDAPEEASTDGTHLEHPTSERLSLHERRRTCELVHLDELARDASRCARPPRRNHDPHSGMAAAVECSAASVHDKTHQKTIRTKTTDSNKAKIPLGSSRLDTTRHVRRVEPMHFCCVELVAQLARHNELDRRDLQLNLVMITVIHLLFNLSYSLIYWSIH